MEASSRSLVVCLPSIHEGGQLAFLHQGREHVFDWSDEKGSNTIQWATSVFNDCEHEVLEVELYTTIQKLLSEPAFRKDGNVLGYHCIYACPHTNKAMFDTLPATLKGIDKLFFEFLSQLGLGVELRHELDGAVSQMSYSEDEYYDDYNDEYESPRKGDRKGDKAVLAKGLRPLYLNDEMDQDGGYDMAYAWNPKHTVERVVWLNRASLNQPAIVYGTYGNEPGVALMYANLVITVTIPSFCKP